MESSCSPPGPAPCPAPETERINEAQAIFAGIAGNYDRPAHLFGLGRYRAWHRELVALVVAHQPELVLDMCTGTGAIAAEITARTDARVVAVDVTRAMLRAREREGLAASRATFAQAAAQRRRFATERST